MSNRIRAVDQMSAINAASFPHSKEKWRDEQLKQLREAALPSEDREAVPIDELARLMSGGGRG